MQVRVPLENGDMFFIDAEAVGNGVVRATRADGAVTSSAETFESSLTHASRLQTGAGGGAGTGSVWWPW